jgi:DinB family
MTRRMTHTAHHRGQQLALLRMLGREEYSNYGPTADTGGLKQNHPRRSTLIRTSRLC